MKQILSLSEIEEQFDSEWVLVGDPETDDELNVKQGMVLCHSKNRDEVYRKAREIHPNHSAILYTGKLPDDVAVVL
jgi:hypothetical protein